MLKLWEYEAEIRAGFWPELAPLLVMLTPPPPDKKVLTVELDLIRQETDSQKRGALLASAVTIASRYFDKEFLWRFFREEVEQMREGTFIEEWLNEKLEQGLQQGERRQSEAILTRILARRFGRLPPGLVKRLALITVVQMEALVDAALDAQDLAAFERAWASMETANWVGIVAQREN